MQSTFTLTSDSTEIPSPAIELGIGFNGVPGVVVLEAGKITGYSGSSDSPTATTKLIEPLMRVTLQASYARAIASALLSAATQAK